VQKLKDKSFDGKVALFTGHADNPALSRIESSVKAYLKHSLDKAYRGENFFWGVGPKAGDTITFVLDRPAPLESIRYLKQCCQMV
jgi:hypothetical protein